MSEIKPIQTYYNGHLFRSRLEARWAVVFNTLGVQYEYEPEGFDLGGGLRYLPDFRVQCYGKRGDYESEPFDLYIEVKGKMTEKDAEKIRRFSGMRLVEKYECTRFATFEPSPCVLHNGGKLDPVYCPPAGDKVCEYLFNTAHIEIKNPILIVDKIPDEGCATDVYLSDRDIGSGLSPFNYETIDGDCFGAYPAATKNGHFYLFGADSNYINKDDEKRVEDAYRAARCARFEHGEMPRVRRF